MVIERLLDANITVTGCLRVLLRKKIAAFCGPTKRRHVGSPLFWILSSLFD